MRRLLYVPIVHGEADLGSMAPAVEEGSASLCGEEKWARHKELVVAFWESLAQHFSALDAANLKLYQDGLPADGELGRRIVEEAARRGSRNHQIILDLLKRGAELRKTESPHLLQEEYENLAGLVRSGPASGRAGAYEEYRHRRDRLTRERDEFVASTIAETLREGEMGVLFMGSHHEVLSHLPPDILVEALRDRDGINSYFQKLISGNDAEMERLAGYLTSAEE